MPGVRLERVSKRFGAARAVDAVSLVVPDGRLLTLLGPRGAARRQRSDDRRPRAE
jgi:ABC-type uncharacterized transport system ATPase subunit